MKISGSELQKFCMEAWPGGPDCTDWFWDHDLFDDEPEADSIYETDDLGPILFQGSGEDPTSGEGYDLERLIRGWHRSRGYDLFTVEVPKIRAEAFRSSLNELSAKIIKQV